jgi:Bacterial SH3 domain
MRRGVAVICCLLFATRAAAESSVLSGDALKAAVTGAVLEVETPLGVKVPIRYFEDGRVSGEARGLAYYLGAETDTGKWWVSSDRLCHKWSKWFDGVLQCIRISRQGSRVFWRRDDGETGTAVISTPPSPPRLVATAPKSAEPTPRPIGREAPEPPASFSASMAGMTIFPPRANNVPVTDSADREPEPSSEPIIAPVIARGAETKTIEPADKMMPASSPKEAAPTAQRSPANPDHQARTFRVAGVAADDVLNVRDGPSADYRATGAILPDAVGVRIVGRCQTEWCPIVHRGVTGWVNSIYLIEDTTIRGSERERRSRTEYRR